MALIHIQNWPQPVEAGRQRILEAALDAGVPFPHGCGSGECGSCKCRLLEGQVSSDRHSEDALTAEEAANGLILACRARPVGDVRVQWLSQAATKPVVRVIGKVARLERVAADVVVVTIALPEGKPPGFRAGAVCQAALRPPAGSQLLVRQSAWRSPGGVPRQGRAERRGQPVRRPATQGGGFGWTSALPSARPAGAAFRRAASSCWAGALAWPRCPPSLARPCAPDSPPESIHLYHGVRSTRDLYAASAIQQLSDEHGFRFVGAVADEPADGRARRAFARCAGPRLPRPVSRRDLCGRTASHGGGGAQAGDRAGCPARIHPG